MRWVCQPTRDRIVVHHRRQLDDLQHDGPQSHNQGFVCLRYCSQLVLLALLVLVSPLLALTFTAVGTPDRWPSPFSVVQKIFPAVLAAFLEHAWKRKGPLTCGREKEL